jgi:hypothetical protein
MIHDNNTDKHETTFEFKGGSLTGWRIAYALAQGGNSVICNLRITKEIVEDMIKLKPHQKEQIERLNYDNLTRKMNSILADQYNEKYNDDIDFDPNPIIIE